MPYFTLFDSFPCSKGPISRGVIGVSILKRSFRSHLQEPDSFSPSFAKRLPNVPEKGMWQVLQVFRHNSAPEARLSQASLPFTLSVKCDLWSTLHTFSNTNTPQLTLKADSLQLYSRRKMKRIKLRQMPFPSPCSPVTFSAILVILKEWLKYSRSLISLTWLLLWWFSSTISLNSDSQTRCWTHKNIRSHWDYAGRDPHDLCIHSNSMRNDSKHGGLFNTYAYH